VTITIDVEATKRAAVGAESSLHQTAAGGAK